MCGPSCFQTPLTVRQWAASVAVHAYVCPIIPVPLFFNIVTQGGVHKTRTGLYDKKGNIYICILTNLLHLGSRNIKIRITTIEIIETSGFKGTI